MKKIFTLILVLLGLGMSAQNTIVLKTGEYVYGKITSVDDKNISIEVANTNKTYNYSTGSVSSYSYKLVNQYNSDQVGDMNSKFKSPGKELQIAAAHFELGTAFSITGAAALAVAASNLVTTTTTDRYGVKTSHYETSKYVSIGGGVLTIVGFILQVESFSHFRKAGILMDKNSVGIAVKF